MRLVDTNILSMRNTTFLFLLALHRARTLQDLRFPAGNRLEALKGDRSRCYSVKGGYADAVTCEDYH